MTAELVNLRQRRKQAARDDRAAVAAANREKFGETKAARQLRAKVQALEQAKLGAHRREPE